MALASSDKGYSLITISILDDDIVIIFPSYPIGSDNRSTKGVRLGQRIFREPVSD